MIGQMDDGAINRNVNSKITRRGIYILKKPRGVQRRRLLPLMQINRRIKNGTDSWRWTKDSSMEGPFLRSNALRGSDCGSNGAYLPFRKWGAGSETWGGAHKGDTRGLLAPPKRNYPSLRQYFGWWTAQLLLKFISYLLYIYVAFLLRFICVCVYVCVFFYLRLNSLILVFNLQYKVFK